MGIEYRLMLAGALDVDDLAARTGLPLAGMHAPATDGRALRSVDLYRSHGFFLTVLARERAFVDALTDDGSWTWETAENGTVFFDLDTFADDSVPQLKTMLRAVRRVLDTGPEDAALILNGDVLLLTRQAGELATHSRATWWEWTYYTGFDDIIGPSTRSARPAPPSPAADAAG